MLLDLGEVGVNAKGVERVLTSLAPRLAALEPGRYRAVCTPAGLPILASMQVDLPATVVPRVPWAVWEQCVLPAVAVSLGAGSIYSHRECGALWGPRLVLHVTEDPEIRWRREPTTDRRELSRRRYSRLLMDRSLRRAVVVTSTAATVRDLVDNHHLDADRATVVPLGVDLDAFHPVRGGPGTEAGGEVGPYFFHLASSDERDRTDLVLAAFARYRSHRLAGARLVVAGGLGARRNDLEALAGELGLAASVSMPGRVSDDQLAALYARSLASLHASPDEGFGLQPLEAMASGALLISTPASAVREVTEGGVVLWSDADPESVARCMCQAEDNPELVRQARVDNRRVAEQFSWDRTAETLHRLLTGS